MFGSYIDEPIMRGGEGGLRYYHRGQQYSVVAMTNGGGGVVERYAYSAYGEPTFFDANGAQQDSSTENNRYTYTGREWDESLNLYHYRARMYDAVSGRFVSRDPFGYVDGSSLYFRYFSLQNIDPSGASSAVLGGGAVAGELIVTGGGVIVSGGTIVVGGVAIVVTALTYKYGRRFACWRSLIRCLSRAYGKATNCAFSFGSNQDLSFNDKAECQTLHLEEFTGQCGTAYAKCLANGWWRTWFPSNNDFQCEECYHDDEDDCDDDDDDGDDDGPSPPRPDRPLKDDHIPQIAA